MQYLLDPIRRDLEQRIKRMAGELGDGLVIDFTNGDLVLDCARRERGHRW